MYPRRNRQILAGLLLGFGIFLTTGPPAHAGAAEARWTVSAYGFGWLGIDDDVTTVRSEEETIHSVSDGSGFGLSLEYRFQRKLGIEVAALFGDLDTDYQLTSGPLSLTDSEELAMETFTLGVNYHLTTSKRTDFFIGAFVGMGTYSDVVFLTEAGRGEKLAFDDDLGFGVKIGFSLPFSAGSGWILAAEVGYFSTILEAEVAGLDLDLNPLIPSIGVGYRF